MDAQTTRINAVYATPVLDILDEGVDGIAIAEQNSIDRIEFYQDEETGTVTAAAVYSFPIENYLDGEALNSTQWDALRDMLHEHYDVEEADSGSDYYEVEWTVELPADATVSQAWDALYHNTKMTDLHNAMNGGYQSRNFAADVTNAIANAVTSATTNEVQPASERRLTEYLTANHPDAKVLAIIPVLHRGWELDDVAFVVAEFGQAFVIYTDHRQPLVLEDAERFFTEKVEEYASATKSTEDALALLAEAGTATDANPLG